MSTYRIQVGRDGVDRVIGFEPPLDEHAYDYVRSRIALPSGMSERLWDVVHNPGMAPAYTEFRIANLLGRKSMRESVLDSNTFEIAFQAKQLLSEIGHAAAVSAVVVPASYPNSLFAQEFPDIHA